MNRFIVVITNRRNLIICIVAILFVVLSALFIAALDFPKVIETDNSQAKTILSPENENALLKDVLSSIVPSGNNVLFENSIRGVGDQNIKSDLTNVSPAEILNKGKNLAYIFVYSDEEYLRPIYSNTWNQSYYQGWLYLPRKIISARHSLFTYVGGVSNTFDMEGELGFFPNITIDNQNYVNFLIYNFDLQNVIQLGNQIVISGTPVKKGVQVISIKIDDVAIQTNEKEYISVQLCTPTGFEIDFQNIQFAKGSKNEDYGPVKESLNETNNDIIDNNIVDVNKQNIVLRQELTHFISDSSKPLYFQYNGGYQTSSVLSTDIDLEEATKFSSDIKFSILYENQKYISPVFHPQWRDNYDREWCYIPRKMYINMKKLFVLPSNKDVAYDLCCELGFFEKYSDIGKDQVGLLINNFTVSDVSMFEDNILVTGTPSRAGMQIVSISKPNLTKYKEYAVRLVTKDLCEFDADVIKN
ncbi:MAG TPA: hypothetical protein VIK78_03970 [Ruminiclostridium sp.]